MPWVSLSSAAYAVLDSLKGPEGLRPPAKSKGGNAAGTRHPCRGNSQKPRQDETPQGGERVDAAPERPDEQRAMAEKAVKDGDHAASLALIIASVSNVTPLMSR